MCSITTISGFLLASSSVSANDTNVSNVSISVPVSCNITTNNNGTGQTYNVSVLNGQYKNDIGKTRLNVFCNTKDTFAIYAVGYSNDTVGNNEMVAGISGLSNIAAGTATSGDTSNWAMKVEAVDGAGVSGEHVSYTPTVLSPFDDFTGIPNAWAKVAEVTSVNGKTNSAAIDASYAIYVAPKQAAANYIGKVRYTVVHPASVDPSAGQANLDYAYEINIKLKSLASGTNVTSSSTDDNLITAFVRSDTLPVNFTPSDANTISLSNSLTPVYVWFDDSDGTMYYYSKAKDIYMNGSSGWLFQYMRSLADISGLKYFIADNVTDMTSMFRQTQISDLTPITNWNVGNVTDMISMFRQTQISDLTPITNWNVGNVTDMNLMFDHAQISDLAPLANWDVGNVTSMASMFKSCSLLSSIAELESWNVEKVTKMGAIFKFTKISDLTPIKDWKVDNVTDMGGMFYSTQISDLSPLADWNVGNVTVMGDMFYSTRISNLTPIANWNTSKVESMTSMFYDIPTLVNSSSIINWDVASIKTGVVTTCEMGAGSGVGANNCFYQMFGGTTPKTNLPIFTSRPGTWDASGTYIPN